MGLWLGQEEFLDLALKGLEADAQSKNEPSYNHGYLDKQQFTEIAHAVSLYKGEVDDDLVRRAKEIILRTENGNIRNMLFFFLYLKKNRQTPASWKACRELALDERAWIWWPAIKGLNTFDRNKFDFAQDLPKEIAPRMFLVLESEYSNVPRQFLPKDVEDYDKVENEACSMVDGLLTPELVRLGPQSASRGVRKVMMKKFNRKVLVETYIGFMRAISKESIQEYWIADNSFFHNCCYLIAAMVRNINAWYGINLWQLGVSEMRNGKSLNNISDIRGVIAETLEWYEENKDIDIPRPEFTIRVVDSEGRPIEDANALFVAYEPDKNGRRKAWAVGPSKRDPNGFVTFSNLSEKQMVMYHLDVSAEGYISRKEIAVTRLYDGRFISDRDNIIRLSKPGSISGRLIDAEGEPIGSAEVVISINSRDVSPQERRQQTTTDDEGRFVFDEVIEGTHLVFYTKFRVHSGATSYKEYGDQCGLALCRLGESEDLRDVCLDLSKSTARLALKIIDGDGEPVDWAHVILGISISDDGRQRSMPIIHSGKKDDQGTSSFENIPAGRWYMYVYNEKLGQSKTVELNLEAGKTTEYEVKYKRSLREVENN